MGTAKFSAPEFCAKKHSQDQEADFGAKVLNSGEKVGAKEATIRS